MKRPYTDNDVFNFMKGFANRESKEEITRKYIAGLISKDEYFKRMKNYYAKTLR